MHIFGTRGRWVNWQDTECLLWTESLIYILNLNVRGPSYLGLTRSISWLLMPGSLRRQDISSHDIDYAEYVSPGRTSGRILSTCVISMWSNDLKCKYILMFPLKNLAHKVLTLLYLCCIYQSTRLSFEIIGFFSNKFCVELVHFHCWIPSTKGQ